MNTKSIRKLLLVVGAAAVLLVAFSLASKPGSPAHADNVFSLQSPPFVGIASAQEVSGASIIEDEAGISAWFQASTSINLDDVRDVFRTIETETADYIIGSVPVANDPESYYESDDVHVYVHTDGWILAYYLAQDPASKIFDWRAYHNSGRTSFSTRLESTIAVIAAEAGVLFPGASYYDFRYPNATHLMLIAEWVGDGNDSFEVNLPGSFVYYERSWSLGTSPWVFNSRYKIDGTLIHEHDPQRNYWRVSYGYLTVAQLPPDEYHQIEVSGDNAYTYGGLALVYRVP